jgi:hypothetical protein
MILDYITTKVTDPYDRQARLYPALLCVLPIVALVAVLYAPDMSGFRKAAAITVSCGGVYLITNICREMGKRLEEKLFGQWGGKPTTQLLRHGNGVVDSVTKHRYHAFLAARIGATFPNADQEKIDPAKADEAYRSGIVWLLGRTRPADGKKFNLLFRENVAYGFRRNALGVKPFGLIMATGSLLWVLIAEGILVGSAHKFIDMKAFYRLPVAAIASLTVSVAMILVWFFFITKTTVRSAAFAYAQALLRTCDDL